MKTLLLAAAAAATTAALAATPANAATVVYSTGSNIAVNYQPLTEDYDGAFRFRVINMTPGDPNGDFTADFTFLSPINGLGSSIAGSVIVSGDLGSDIDFYSVNINGYAGSVINSGAASSAFRVDAPISAGLNTLTFTGRLNPNGNRVGDGLVTGSLTLAAAGMVPEPATWGLFILGFGAIGGTLRRRNASIRKVRAKLNFA
jgi:hypothetical protein